MVDERRKDMCESERERERERKRKKERESMKYHDAQEGVDIWGCSGNGRVLKRVGKVP